jgi:hypothetical protein
MKSGLSGMVTCELSPGAERKEIVETEKGEAAQDYHFKTIADVLRYPDLDRREFRTEKVEILLVRLLPKDRSLRAVEKQNGNQTNR